MEYSLLFKCPKCRWWIAGTHRSEPTLSQQQVSEVAFNLECGTSGCGWKGQLSGREGTQPPDRLPGSR
jgi:hypothetical protein